MIKEDSILGNMSDSLLRAWHKHALKKSYKSFAQNTNRLSKLKDKTFLQARRILLRFLKYYPSTNLDQELLNSIAKKRQVEFSDLNKLITEIRDIAIKLQNLNKDEKATQDLKYVREEMLNLQDFYTELSAAKQYEDLEQKAIPYIGVDLTNRMEVRLLNLSTHAKLKELYKNFTKKLDRSVVENMSSAAEQSQKAKTEIARVDPQARNEADNSETQPKDYVEELQARKIDATELLGQKFDDTTKFLGTVYRMNKDTVNASMAIQPELEHALTFSEIKIPNLDSNNLFAENQIQVELPINTDLYSNSKTIFLPSTPGYQVTHLSQINANGSQATHPLLVTQNAIGAVKLNNDQNSDVTKIHYLLEQKSQKLDAKTHRDLTIEIADPIDLAMHDRLIKKLPNIQDKIPFIANKVFSSVNFGESLSETEIAQLNLLICNEFRRAGIASYISTNGKFTQDPEGQDSIMVEPYSYSIVYFNEDGEAHEFAATQSFNAFTQASLKSDAQSDSSSIPLLHDCLTASVNLEPATKTKGLISPLTRKDQEKTICAYSLQNANDFENGQEFLNYYALELEQGKAQWQRNIQLVNVEAIVKHLAELERVDNDNLYLDDGGYKSIIDYANNPNSDHASKIIRTPHIIKKIINQAYFMDKDEKKEDLIVILKSNPELRKRMRYFIFKSLDIFTAAEQYSDVENGEMYIKHVFEGIFGNDLNKKLFSAIFRTEDLRDLSLDELEGFLNNKIFFSERSNFSDIKITILTKLYKTLINKKTQVLSDGEIPNQQMSKLFDRTSELLAKLCSFRVDIKGDYYGLDPILDDGYDCTPSFAPSESYSLMQDLAHHNPKQLEKMIAESIFSENFAAFINTKKHNEKSNLCDLILRANPAPNIFLIKEDKILLQDTFKLQLREMMRKKLLESLYVNGLVGMLKNLYKFGVDTKGIISDEEFNKFLQKVGYKNETVQMKQLFDLEIEPEPVRQSCPERGIKFKPRSEDEFRLRLYQKLPTIKLDSTLVHSRVNPGKDFLNPIIEVDLERAYQRISSEALHAKKITELSQLYRLAGPKDRLDESTKLSKEFYDKILAEFSREISLEEVNNRNRPSFVGDLFDSLGIEDKKELINKYNPEFLTLLKSLGLSIEEVLPQAKTDYFIANAKQEIENEIQRIENGSSDPLSLGSRLREFTGKYELVDNRAINFLTGVYNILDEDKQKTLRSKLCSTLDQNLNESENVIALIDEALIEACQKSVFAKDIKALTNGLNNLGKRLFRHNIIYDAKLKETLKHEWQWLNWYNEPLFNKQKNPLTTGPAQDLIKTKLPGLSPDSLFSHLARMKSSSHAFNYIFNKAVCNNLKRYLHEGNFEWTRAKKLNNNLSKRKPVDIQSKPLIDSKTRSGYSGSRAGSVLGSTEYNYSRPHVQGDDIRKIDWSLYARTGKPHTKTLTDDVELRSQEYIIDLSWLNSYHNAIKDGYIGLEPFENLVQFIYQNGHKKNNKTLTITCNGVPILQLSKEEINGIVQGKAIKDDYGRRTRLMDLFLSLRALATANLNPFNSIESPILTVPYHPRYKNSQVHILIPGGARSKKITNSYHLFDSWSKQQGSEILVASQIN
ncbi:MAG: DUF58 domain-containing protein [Candidatus Caenarcaniphilales bacterium]|jgi:hypothetical protein|nr:DUF58 domain-containing protein [Candidatus Caenarcaniphilales bacterium]